MFELRDSTDAQADFWADQSKFRAFSGGISSGKTFAGAIEILRQPARSVGMVVAPTFPMIRKASLKTFLELAKPAGLIKSFNKADWEMELVNGSTIYWASADNPDSLRGPNLGWFWMDEGAFCSFETWLIMIGRLRRSPGRGWMTTTPQGKKHWLYKELVKPGKIAVHKASTASNKFVARDFVESLGGHGSTSWQLQELEGEFVDDGGAMFRRSWYPIVDQLPEGQRFSIRVWDCAATPGGGDWSVGMLLHLIKGKIYISDLVRGQWGPDELDAIQVQTAELDGYGVTILLEREPGSAGKRANQYLKNRLANYMVQEEQPTGSKLVRAMPAARKASRGEICLVKGPWIGKFFDELEEFTGSGKNDEVDDQVDCQSNGVNYFERCGGLELI